MSGAYVGLKHETKKALAEKSLHDSSPIKNTFPFKFVFRIFFFFFGFLVWGFFFFFQNTAYK